MISPLAQLEDAYGRMDTPVVTSSQLAGQRVKDAAFARTRILRSLPGDGSTHAR